MSSHEIEELQQQLKETNNMLASSNIIFMDLFITVFETEAAILEIITQQNNMSQEQLDDFQNQKLALSDALARQRAKLEGLKARLPQR